MDNYVEIKIFPGLKVTSRYIPPEQSKSNWSISKNNIILNLSATFSDYFRRSIKENHRQIYNNKRF